MTDSIGLFFLAIGALALVQLAGPLRAILRSVQSTEAMTRRLLSHQGVDWETAVEPSERVKNLAVNPKDYVEAIKAYRRQTGLGLQEAKAVVDGLSRAGRGTA